MPPDTIESPLRIVVAGGIGSGKSTVGDLLRARGALVLDSDAIGHDVLTSGEVVALIAGEWPSTVRDGVVDRGRLGEIVFREPAALRRLEAITHPRIRQAILAEAGRHPDETVVVELPLMPEWLGEGWIVWVVDAPREERIRRVVRRGGTSEDAAARIASQPTREMWLEAADVVIENSGDLDDLERAVAAAWSQATA